MAPNYINGSRISNSTSVFHHICSEHKVVSQISFQYKKYSLLYDLENKISMEIKHLSSHIDRCQSDLKPKNWQHGVKKGWKE